MWLMLVLDIISLKVYKDFVELIIIIFFSEYLKFPI